MRRIRLFQVATLLFGITIYMAADVNGAVRKHSSTKVKRATASKSKRVARGRSRETKKGRVARGRRSRHHFYDDVTGSVQTSRSTQIPTERVTEIQRALIKAGFMDGPPTGQYDSNTSEAMKEFQASNGLFASGTPSAPALKKLGVSKTSNDGYAVPIKSVSVSSDKSTPKPSEKTKQ